MVKDDLTDRARRVLQAIIQEYIETAEPVGSRRVCHKYNFDISPATVRNTMADLEELGFLRQPHTSAGRIPTENGLRTYIDSILELSPISEAEKNLVNSSLDKKVSKLDELLKDASRILSFISGHAAIVSVPRFTQTIFRHIEFIRLRRNIILVICVASTGMVQNKIIQVEEDLIQEKLDRFSELLTSMLPEMTLEGLRNKIFSEMAAERELFAQLLSGALDLSGKNLETGGQDAYIEGKTNILNYPELCQVEKMKAIFAAFEEKSILIRLLDKCIASRGLQIFLGSESRSCGMEGCSIVASSYATGRDVYGTLGIIGPVRMDYKRVIPIVDYTAKLLGKLIERCSLPDY